PLRGILSDHPRPPCVRSPAASADGRGRSAGSKNGARFLRLRRHQNVRSVTMRYALIQRGESRSFPEGDAFLSGACKPGDADVVIYLSESAQPDPAKAAVLIELGIESLAVHAGEDEDESRANF